MQYHAPLLSLKSIWAPAMLTQTATPSTIITRSYTDVDTGIAFNGHVSPTGYRFGMMLPQQPTTDFIAQLVSPLTDGAGWGGVSLGSSMTGPLLLAAWQVPQTQTFKPSTNTYRPNGNKVTTAALVATNYTPSGLTPYTANPLTFSPIPQGTFTNTTHLSATFLCRGCINTDSFDPSWADSPPDRDIFFGYAFSPTAVASPSDIDTRLSDHTGPGAGYGAFKVVLGDAKSDEYDVYAAMAEEDGQLPSGGGNTVTSLTAGTGASATVTGGTDATSTTGATASMTGTGVPAGTTPDVECWEPECQTPSGSDYSHREMPQAEFVALVVLGVVYLVQAVLP